MAVLIIVAPTHRAIKTVHKNTNIKHAKTDRQTDRQTVRQSDRQTEQMQLTINNNHNN